MITKDKYLKQYMRSVLQSMFIKILGSFAMPEVVDKISITSNNRSRNISVDISTICWHLFKTVGTFQTNILYKWFLLIFIADDATQNHKSSDIWLIHKENNQETVFSGYVL